MRLLDQASLCRRHQTGECLPAGRLVTAGLMPVSTLVTAMSFTWALIYSTQGVLQLRAHTLKPGGSITFQALVVCDTAGAEMRSCCGLMLVHAIHSVALWQCLLCEQSYAMTISRVMC